MSLSLSRLRAVVLKELRQLRRDRLTFAMILGIPTMQLLLFGYAINMDVRHLSAAIVDQAQTQRSRELLAVLAQTQVFDFERRLRTPSELTPLLESGRIQAGVVIPPDFERRLATGERPAAQLVVDGSEQVVQQAARQISVLPLSALEPARAGEDAPGTTGGGIEVVSFYNPQRRAALNTVPGLVGVILTMTMILFTGIALVRERERGNLEFLITTPLSPFELTLGKVLPYVGIGLLQMTVVLVLGRVIFGVPIRGSLVSLFAAALVFILASLALGVLISTLTQTQFQAMQASTFTFLPQLLLSGFMFPFEGMPRPVQLLAEVLPLTHFLRLVRGIMLRGAALSQMWVDLLALVAFAAAALTLATLRFHKRLD